MQVPGGSSGASSGAALLAAIGTLLMTDRASGRVRCLASGCIDPDIDIRQGITRTCGATVQPDGLHVNNLCGPGYFCNDKKVCERAGLPGVGCQTSLQCLPGMTCENEVCVVTRLPGDSCEGDADCSYHNGQCIGNRCAGLGTGDGCSTRDTPQRCDKVKDAVLVEVCAGVDVIVFYSHPTVLGQRAGSGVRVRRRENLRRRAARSWARCEHANFEWTRWRYECQRLQ